MLYQPTPFPGKAKLNFQSTLSPARGLAPERQIKNVLQSACSRSYIMFVARTRHCRVAISAANPPGHFCMDIDALPVRGR